MSTLGRHQWAYIRSQKTHKLLRDGVIPIAQIFMSEERGEFEAFLADESEVGVFIGSSDTLIGAKRLVEQFVLNKTETDCASLYEVLKVLEARVLVLEHIINTENRESRDYWERLAKAVEENKRNV